ncbi:MAG: hypothetical protein OWQ55_00545 [Sulfuracidifex metallicus]|nr:hypothetical protein [Sulfuracidifex metallicus]MCY0849236.1 hypothetical protein [Sulfuracidifex metallicus]
MSVSKPGAYTPVAKDEGKKKLSTVDLFFLSFGDQVPFISLLIFGTVMITYVGTEGAFAMLIATAVVAINGLVVNRMRMRFRRGGGYYIYGNYSLTPRVDVNTG